MKIWILQFYYGTTSTRLFDGKDFWYAKTKDVSLTKEQYTFIRKKLGLDYPGLDIYEGTEEQEKNGNAIWVNFDRFNTIVSKLEQHVADIGQGFILTKIDLTVNDDKLRHTSRRFREEGLQITGFRGCIFEPVINDNETVHNGIIAGIHVSHHGDSSGTIVKSLYKKLGYRLTPSLYNSNDSCVMLDRGYDNSSVTRYMMKVGNLFLGTHSQKKTDWPFSSSTNAQDNKKIIVTKGVRAACFAKRKALQVPYFAAIYRNGNSV